MLHFLDTICNKLNFSEKMENNSKKQKVTNLSLQKFATHRLNNEHVESLIKYRSDTTDPTPQAVGGCRLSWSTKVFQLTPQLHQTHLLWGPSFRKTETAASFRERLRA